MLFFLVNEATTIRLMGKLNSSAQSSKGAGKGLKSFEKEKHSSAANSREATRLRPKVDDVSDIFSALRKQPDVQSQQRAIEPNMKEKQSKSDGLYRAAAATVEMADDDFFGASSSVMAGKAATKKKKSSAALVSGAPKRSLEKEGVDRVITEDELRKLTSVKEEAGTTPNCPFDCDCCF